MPIWCHIIAYKRLNQRDGTYGKQEASLCEQSVLCADVRGSRDFLPALPLSFPLLT